MLAEHDQALASPADAAPTDAPKDALNENIRTPEEQPEESSAMPNAPTKDTTAVQDSPSQADTTPASDNQGTLRGDASPSHSPARLKESADPNADSDGQTEARDFDLGRPSTAQSSAAIDTIMSQFSGEDKPGEDEIMSPRMEIAASNRTSVAIRKQSLDDSISALVKERPSTPKKSLEENESKRGAQELCQIPDTIASPPKRTSSLPSVGRAADLWPGERPVKDSSRQAAERKDPTPARPQGSDREVSFDFHHFLRQLRRRDADPVVSYLRSFLEEFSKKQWMVHEQVKIVSDFLAFISKEMKKRLLWSKLSPTEFDYAIEGMEKLVMNRLYEMTFSPMIPSQEEAMARMAGTRGRQPRYRMGQHQEDVERDTVLAQKVEIYKWVSEQHLDMKPMKDSKVLHFFGLAQNELRNVNKFRAPRDKVICILNCCKVIFKVLEQNRADQSADEFVPFLIFIILKTNPPNLVSNVQYILRFRNEDKLAGEVGYYISSLLGAIQFIEEMDRTRLTISDAEFEQLVEQSVSEFAERAGPAASNTTDTDTAASNSNTVGPASAAAADLPSKSREQQPQGVPERAPQPAEPTWKAAEPGQSDFIPSSIPSVAAGFLRTIQTPLASIGHIFSDPARPPARDAAAAPGATAMSGLGRPASPDGPSPALPPRTSRLQLPPRTSSRQLGSASPASLHSRTPPSPFGGHSSPGYSSTSPGPPARSPKDEDHLGQRPASPTPFSPAPALPDPSSRPPGAGAGKAIQLSAEEDEARQIQARETDAAVDTLSSMFPQLDIELIRDVVQQKSGQIAPAVDACLELSEDR